MRKCLQCGGEMTTARENHLFDQHGMRVTLVDVDVHRCATCGELEVAIPAIAELIRVLADALIHSPHRLAKEEIRFLRKSMGWSGKDFAAYMGVDPATVSRWEAGRQAMGPIAERLLRMLVSKGVPIHDYTVNDLVNLVDEPPSGAPLRVQRRGKTWQTTKAVA